VIPTSGGTPPCPFAWASSASLNNGLMTIWAAFWTSSASRARVRLAAVGRELDPFRIKPAM
jgi:hypothetical protein